MKGVTYLIILSVVWSIVSGIIEKRKAKARKAAQSGVGVSAQQQAPQVLNVDPVTVKVESLRRRRLQQPQPAVQEHAPETTKYQKIDAKIAPIKPLYKQGHPVPEQEKKSQQPSPAKQLAHVLKNRRNIRTAIVLTEILNKSVSQR